jgi:hypothetical protein
MSNGVAINAASLLISLNCSLPHPITIRNITMPNDQTNTPNSEDIFVWPDGEYCYRYEYDRGDYTWKSDDCEILYLDTERWVKFTLNPGELLS